MSQFLISIIYLTGGIKSVAQIFINNFKSNLLNGDTITDDRKHLENHIALNVSEHLLNLRGMKRCNA